MKKILCLLFCLLAGSAVFGQEHEESKEEHNRHAIVVGIGHAAVLQGVRDGEVGNLYIPSFLVQYNYRISEKFALGLNIDVLIENFAIEDREGLEVERERPVATILVGGYELGSGFSLLLGGGVEWEKNENYGLIRFGFDYTHPLGDKGFEFLATLNSDILFGGYNTINLGLGVGKTF
ncbi:hypothetical protein [Aureitalea marina]|uniref:Outer membrane protein beta-barrel domain-containing protein n=1 Tax=Aureitalea marina TaxID=930804 RepID=A0A2S7KSL9_9FLAO|nr:hypothetical protein [Aureitalea marina]PQB05578.1 hypothetical protein BST85_12220 [Aureitalea marina]